MVAKFVGTEKLIVKLNAMLVVQFLTRPPDECHPFGNLIDDCLMLINESCVVEIQTYFSRR